MEPIPGWTRACGIAAAVLAAPLLVLLVGAGTITAAITTATVHRMASYTVGETPHLVLDVQLATLLVEPGPPGLIVASLPSRWLCR